MKVTRNTEDTLIIEDRPWLITSLLAVFLLGTLVATVIALGAQQYFVGIVFAIFTSFVALFLAVFVRRVQVILQRRKNTVIIRARTLRSYTEVVHDLRHLSHAELEGLSTARCVLVFNQGMSKGRHPLTLYATNGPRPKRVCDAINAWLPYPRALDSRAIDA